MQIKRTAYFAAAHFLINYKGKCSRLHGHNWKVAVEIDGEPSATTDMVLDFNEIKEVIDRYDHSVLIPGKNKELGQDSTKNLFIYGNYRFPMTDCAVIPYSQTTAENIALSIKADIRERLKPHIEKFSIRVTVNETVNSSVIA